MMTANRGDLGPPTAATQLIRARSRLELNGSAEGAGLASHLADSWHRCLGARLDPFDRPEHMVVTQDVFGNVLARHDILRRLARPELDLLFGQVRASNYMLALGTPEGVVTDVLADTSFLDTEAGRTVVEGSIWCEEVRGTNAMGLTLHDLAPRSVWRGEHFFRCHQAVSCLSVPIFDSAGGLAGVLDASTASAEWHPHTMALLGMSAANIEAGLFHFEQGDHTILRMHPRAEYLFTMSAGLLAIDRHGTIVAMSRRAREVLQLAPAVRPDSLDDLVVGGMAAIAPQLARGETVNGRPFGGGTVFLASNHWRMRQPVVVAPANPEPASRKGARGRGGSGRAGIVVAPCTDTFVAEDRDLRRQLVALHRVLPSRAPILITGETGTGKRRLARHIHQLADVDAPLVTIHCTGITDAAAIEAFRAHGCHPDTAASGNDASGNDASGDRAGALVLIDRIDELPLHAQAVLARFLDDCAEAGWSRVRIVSTMEREADGGGVAMHPDLYFHVASFVLNLPPLRRRRDLVHLAEAHLAAVAPGKTLDRAARDTLRAHDWPGNLREMESRLRVASALADGDVISMQDLLRALAVSHPGEPETGEMFTTRTAPCRSCRDSTLRRQRCIRMRETYVAEGRNAVRTARVLGIARSTLYEHLRGFPAVGTLPDR